MPSAPDPLSPFPGFHLFHRYTRAQALTDGALVDASTLAREAGIRHPVALTAAAWAEAVTLTPVARRAGNDLTGRLWDVLWMLRLAMGGAPEGCTSLGFEVLVVRGSVQPSLVRLRAVCGPGDSAEPVVTVMLPGED